MADMGYLSDIKDLYTDGEADAHAYDLEDAPVDNLPSDAHSWEELEGDNSVLASEQPKTVKPDDADNPV